MAARLEKIAYLPGTKEFIVGLEVAGTYYEEILENSEDLMKKAFNQAMLQVETDLQNQLNNLQELG